MNKYPDFDESTIECPLLKSELGKRMLNALQSQADLQIKNEPSIGRGATHDHSGANSFIRLGEGWSIVFQGQPCLLFHRSGMIPLSILLASPNTEFSALSLVRLINPPPPELLPQEVTAKSCLTEDFSGQDHMSYLETTDDKTLSAVKTRLVQLNQEITATKQLGQLHKIPKLEKEQSALIKYLQQTSNEDGRPRMDRNDVDRARRAVGKAITAVINAIRKAGHHALSRHLSQSIPHPSGSIIVYAPDPMIAWQITSSPNLPPAKAQRTRSGSAITYEGENTGVDHDD